MKESKKKMLPPKAIFVLANFRKELLSAPVAPKPEGERPQTNTRPSTFKQRRARTRGRVFQQMCRRREWASPIFAFFLALLIPFAAPAQTKHAPKCGIELQLKKTSADSDWNKVDLTPGVSTIAMLNGLKAPTHAQLLASAGHRFEPELHVYTVQGYLAGFKLESDMDFHIVISDPNDPRATMIVEMVSPACLVTPFKKEAAGLRTSWEARFGKATPAFNRKKFESHKIKVEITGVGFFDFLHGQTGVAKNGMELHRVLSWREVQ